jgi:hypothetical protein
MSVGFISEMVAVPIHGGGVTLERVLGSDLTQFGWFAETIRYPCEKAAAYPFATSYSYPFWPIEKWLAPVLGSTIPYRLASHPLTRKRFALQTARRLLRDEPALRQCRVLACPQSDITLLVLEELRKLAGVAYVTWIMDDHLVSWKDGGWHYPPGFESIMRRHLVEARQIYVISPAMQEFYQTRFGVESTVLSGPTDPRDPIPPRRDIGNCIRLAYFGSLGPWQNDAIAILAPLISDENVSLDIFSHNPDAVPSVLRAAGACLRDGIPASDVMTRTAEYDGVVLPISFTEERRNMSYFNIATKFSECLASGVPTLVIGPPDAIMVKIAQSHGAAVIVDQQSPDAARAALEVLRDPARRATIVRAALRLGREEYSESVMRSRWEAASAFLFEER